MQEKEQTRVNVPEMIFDWLIFLLASEHCILSALQVLDWNQIANWSYSFKLSEMSGVIITGLVVKCVAFFPLDN